MEQGSILNKKIAIIGAGPAGCICAKFLADANIDFVFFEHNKPLKTLLYTGGGKCNLAYAEFNFKDLTKNYPRGEKFLYSIFSKFSTQDTLNFFNHIGVKTYIREDNRIFPVSNSAKEVRSKLLSSINKKKFINEKVIRIEKDNNSYEILTEKNKYPFDIVIVAIGGHAGIKIFDHLNIKINPQIPALVGLTTEEDLSSMSGVQIKNAEINIENKKYVGDILFTHQGVSGPAIYTISSIYANKQIPFKIAIKLADVENLQEQLNKAPHQEIVNALKKYIPKALAKYILNDIKIQEDTTCTQIDKARRKAIQEKITKFELTISGKMKNGEIVSCGGIDLNELFPQTLENKQYQNLYFCGEILDIDGLCGGFNLQNCWSTGYVVAQSIINKLSI